MAGQREIDADDAGFLGAREQPRIGAAGAADRNGLRILQVIGLVTNLGAGFGEEAGLEARRRLGQQRRSPILVGDAEPAVRHVEFEAPRAIAQDGRLGDGLVAVFLQALVAEIADQAFMQDVVARDLRRAVAGDERERIERDRRAADVGDVVLDGEEIAVVDRNGAAEGEAFAIVPFERHRVARRQRARALLLPYRLAVGKPPGRARGRDPAELGIIGMGRVRRREQHDRGRFRIDGIAEFLQRQVVDARALQRDAARKPRRLDLDAGRGGDRGVAADDGRRARLAGRRAWWRMAPRPAAAWSIPAWSIPAPPAAPAC